MADDEGTEVSGQEVKESMEKAFVSRHVVLFSHAV